MRCSASPVPVDKKSPHSHGRSELWERPDTLRVLEGLLQDVATNVREARNDLELTQEQLAERCGLHVKQIQRVETQKANPTIATLAALALGLQRSVVELLEPGANEGAPD